MKNTNRIEPPAVGGSSLLLIFAALCFTVFTLLTLSTAQADRKLSDVAANVVSDYYKADLEAEEIFSMLREGTVNMNEYLSKLNGFQGGTKATNAINDWYKNVYTK